LLGLIYALMAAGLALIFSVLGGVNFAHGQLTMLGGYVAYLLLASFAGLPPLAAVAAAGLLAFAIGAAFQRVFLRPAAEGRVERPGEYILLSTFGLGFFLQYLTLALVGPYPKKAARYFDLPALDRGAIELTAATLRLGPVSLSATRLTAALLALVLLAGLLVLLRRTAVGRALRAVSQDRLGAAASGVDPVRMDTLAFGLGSMMAGLAGAALVPVFSWVPGVGVTAAVKSYVILVLGGLGSIPGAVVGGLVVGVVESLGAGLLPDASRAIAYRDAYGLVIFALVLLLRPQGLFGRKAREA
jgi:branched-chain amino acid transport system permease protein